MITLCCPSRGRPQLAKRMYDKAMEFCTDKKNIEILLYVNEDDETLSKYLSLFHKLPGVKVIVGPHQSPSFSWNQLARKAKHDLICLIGDDVQIETANWEKIIQQQFDSVDDKILMVVPSTGRPRGYTETQWRTKKTYYCKKDELLPAPHYVIHKNWFDTLGYLCPPQFWHFYVDTYTQSIARRLKRCVFVPEVVFKVKKIIDKTATQVRSHLNIRKRDDFVWETCRRHMQSDITALQEFIKKF